MEKKYTDIWETLSREELSWLLEPIREESPSETLSERVARAAAARRSRFRRRLAGIAAAVALTLLGGAVLSIMLRRPTGADPAPAGIESASSEERSGAPAGPAESTGAVFVEETAAPAALSLSTAYQAASSALRCYDGGTLLYEKDLMPFHIGASLELADGVLLVGTLCCLGWETTEGYDFSVSTAEQGYFEYKGRRWTIDELPQADGVTQYSLPWMMRLDENGQILWESEITGGGAEEALSAGRICTALGASAAEDGFIVFCALRSVSGGAWVLSGQELLCLFYGPEGELRRETRIPAPDGLLSTDSPVPGTSEGYALLLFDEKGNIVQLMRLDEKGQETACEAVPEALFPASDLYTMSSALARDGRIWISGYRFRTWSEDPLARQARLTALERLENVPPTVQGEQELMERLLDPAYDGSDPDEAERSALWREAYEALLYVYDVAEGRWYELARREGFAGGQLYPDESGALCWERLYLRIVIPAYYADSYSTVLVLDYHRSFYDADGVLLAEEDMGQRTVDRVLEHELFSTRCAAWYQKLTAR